MNLLRKLSITALLMVCVFALAGCGAATANTYENEKDPQQTMELASYGGMKMWAIRNVHGTDMGSFIVRNGDKVVSGDYTRHDDSFELKDTTGKTWKLTVSGENSLRGENGEVWRPKSPSKSLGATVATNESK